MEQHAKLVQAQEEYNPQALINLQYMLTKMGVPDLVAAQITAFNAPGTRAWMHASLIREWKLDEEIQHVMSAGNVLVGFTGAYTSVANLETHKMYKLPFGRLTLSRNGKYLVVRQYTSQCDVYETETSRLIGQIQGETSDPLAISDDGQTVYCAKWLNNGPYKTTMGTVKMVVIGTTNVDCIDVAKDVICYNIRQRGLVCQKAGGAVKALQLDDLPYIADNIKLSPNGTWLVTVREVENEPQVHIWNLSTGKIFHMESSNTFDGGFVANHQFVSKGDFSIPKIWDLTTGIPTQLSDIFWDKLPIANATQHTLILLEKNMVREYGIS